MYIVLKVLKNSVVEKELFLVQKSMLVIRLYRILHEIVSSLLDTSSRLLKVCTICW